MGTVTRGSEERKDVESSLDSSLGQNPDLSLRHLRVSQRDALKDNHGTPGEPSVGSDGVCTGSVADGKRARGVGEHPLLSTPPG